MNFSPESSPNRHPNDHPIYKPGPHIEPKVAGYINLQDAATVSPESGISAGSEARLSVVKAEIIKLLDEMLRQREKFSAKELIQKEEDLIALRIEESSLNTKLGIIKASPVVLPDDEDKLGQNKNNVH